MSEIPEPVDLEQERRDWWEKEGRESSPAPDPKLIADFRREKAAQGKPVDDLSEEEVWAEIQYRAKLDREVQDWYRTVRRERSPEPDAELIAQYREEMAARGKPVDDLSDEEVWAKIRFRSLGRFSLLFG